MQNPEGQHAVHATQRRALLPENCHFNVTSRRMRVRTSKSLLQWNMKDLRGTEGQGTESLRD